MASASDTEIEPANGPPFGVIDGALTLVFFEPVALVVVVGDKLVVVETVPVLAAEVVDVVVFNGCVTRRWRSASPLKGDVNDTCPPPLTVVPAVV